MTGAAQGHSGKTGVRRVSVKISDNRLSKAQLWQRLQVWWSGRRKLLTAMSELNFSSPVLRQMSCLMLPSNYELPPAGHS